MRGNMNKKALLMALFAATVAAGCAQDVGDIDRTNPNKVRKADLTDGSWWMSQKIVETPGTGSLFSGYEGHMMDTDKIRFVAEEKYLIAYRTYSHLVGADGDTTIDVDNYDEVYNENYKGAVRAMYTIESHFDVQRTYDAATGEQSNVIEENTSDRPWYEREYMRVDWASNPIVNWWYKWVYDIHYDQKYTATYDNDPLRGAYFEYDQDGELVYFDTQGMFIAQPTIYDFYFEVMGYGYNDGEAGTETRVVTSFVKDLGDKDPTNNYEPLDYSNADMNRFGAFRTERYTYDPKTGRIMNSGRIELAERHNIWKASYDANGNVIPVEDREIRTIPYYIHHNLKEPLMAKASRQAIEEWDVAFRRAAYITKNPEDTVINGLDIATSVDWEANRDALDSLKGTAKYIPHVFVPCEVPVAKDDDPACRMNNGVDMGVGYTPREGDFRKNYLWIVPQNQDNGLLGYGPHTVDPLTGRVISNQSHVYTAPMNNIATGLVDQIKFYNGEISGDGIRQNDYAIQRGRLVRDKLLDISKIPGKVLNAKLNNAASLQERRRINAERYSKLGALKKFNAASADAKLQKVIDSGLLATELDNERMRHVAQLTGASQMAAMSDDAKQYGSLYNELSFQERQLKDSLRKAMGAKGYCFSDIAAIRDVDYASLAAKYKGRTDYDNIYKEIRAEIHRAIALHEMGHGMTLRHNFSGTYDSMNYFDDYWKLRADDRFNKEKFETVGDLYALYNHTKAQLEGDIYGNMYTSIMDYQPNYTEDQKGLGRYDLAAITYIYSGGTSRRPTSSFVSGKTCDSVGGVEKSNNCIYKQKGLVEVFTQNNNTAEALKASNAVTAMGRVPALTLQHVDTTGTSTFDDLTAVGQNYLELVHYHDIFQPMIGANGAYNSANCDKDGYDANACKADLSKFSYNFLKNRKYVRLDEYLEKKGTPEAIIRVPYIFGTDDNHGTLRTIHTWDHGADYMEQVLYKIRNYDSQYWFMNFARGRAFWDSYGMSDYYFDRTLMPLSDYFQSWYAGDRRLMNDVIDTEDDLNSTVNFNAAAASFNFLARVVATPSYGQFCVRQDNGNLFGLSAEDETTQNTSIWYRRAYCGSETPDVIYVPQGEGRRKQHRYDVNAGFDYSKYDLETAHWITSYYALRTIFDNWADVIVDTGEMGAYTFGLYDMFRDQTIKLANALYNEDYSVHSPILVTKDDAGNDITMTLNGEEVRSGYLVYPPIATVSLDAADGSRVYYDPLTGMTTDEFDDLRAAGYKTVESDSSLNEKVYAVLYGMLLTGPVGMDPTFYDQFHIYRKGSGETVTPADHYRTVEFHNPFTGDVYQANELDCGSSTSGICNINNRIVPVFGGAELVKRAQKRADAMLTSWNAFNEAWQNLTPAEQANKQGAVYQDYINKEYKWLSDQSELEYAIRDIDFVRSVYEVFGSLW